MEEGETFVCGTNIIYFSLNSIFSLTFSGNYNEQLRIIDFPVYISGENGTDMRQLIPDT